MSKSRHGAVGLFALGAAVAIAGCGAGYMPTPELRSAQNEVDRARNGPAGRLEPDQLHVAERTLARAEAAPDGSPEEATLAYLAQRQALTATAAARASELRTQIERERREYGEEVTTLARERGEALEITRQRLAESELSLQQQQQLIAEREQELAQEQTLRAAAEERTEAALERVRDLALVRVDRTETVITLSGEVLFVTDRAELRPEARERLTAVANALRESPDQTIVIEGHTDSRGGDAYNHELSQRRADAVRSFLISAGVPNDRMTAIGRGESEPIAENATAEGRANNRRVEIILRPAAGVTEETEIRPITPTTPSGTTPSGTP